MAAATYGVYPMAHNPSFVSDSFEQGPAPEEQYINTFFCRALYDYQTNDPSSLSFRKNDIIEVLSCLESGWWDGLLGEERGWFPSNYVVTISDQEAETALSSTEYDANRSTPPEESTVDMVRSLQPNYPQVDREGDWLDSDVDYPSTSHRSQVTANGALGGATQSQDFWVPQVSPDGRIFYVNTQTGQRARDLPQEADVSADTELVGLSQASSHMGSINGVIQEAGFGVPHRSKTPEPWIRRLADDGLSYYYLNKLDGGISWTFPTSDTTPTPSYEHPHAHPLQSSSSFSAGIPSSREIAIASRIGSDSLLHQGKEQGHTAGDRRSVYSDDSDIHPRQRDRAQSSTSEAGQSHRYNSAAQPTTAPILFDLTSGEQAAKALQDALAPSSPESPIQLARDVQEAIQTVIDHLRTVSSTRRGVQPKSVDSHILAVVTTVRNLLYITATPTGHIPSHLYPRDPNDTRFSAYVQAMQTHLKAAHRKVAGTLSKLVLSALAAQYDPASALSPDGKPSRMELDASELERSIVAFVAEVQHFRDDNPQSKPPSGEPKRLNGTFLSQNIGFDIPGAGFAGLWKGFGFVLGQSPPSRPLDSGVMDEVKTASSNLERKINYFASIYRSSDITQDQLLLESRAIIAVLYSVLKVLTDINIAEHVDVDGARADPSNVPNYTQYSQTVEKSRILLRTLELASQAAFDDAAALLLTLQTYTASSLLPHTGRTPTKSISVDKLLAGIKTNVATAVTALETLIIVGQDEAELGQGAYNGSIEWRRSRSSIIYTSAAAPVAHPPIDNSQMEEDVVDMELAFSRPGFRTVSSLDTHGSSTLYHGGSQYTSQTSLAISERTRSEGGTEPLTPTWSGHDPSEVRTLVGPASHDLDGDLLDDAASALDEEGPSSVKSPQRGAKILKLLGSDAPQHYVSKLQAEAKPWYLRPTYDESAIMMDPDGGVRAGTKMSLVERLTAHETTDPTFNKNFLMTFKSFMDLNELFELLVQRFWIPPPEGLDTKELEDWRVHKQHVIRARVLNTFRIWITDDDVLEKDDMYILNRIKDFVSNVEVQRIAAAKQLLVLIDRAQMGGEGTIKHAITTTAPPPTSIVPKVSGKSVLKLLEIDHVELARQLTLMESHLYKKIRPIECLQRSRESKPGKKDDNISSIIQLSNRIANWVAETVLSKEDSRKRAAIIKHFIATASQCRITQNFSTMVAITSGLNTPPIRRLKRSWEQVNQRFMQQLHLCESTIDSNKNFNNYRSLLASITPPCVPFIGTYLTTLTFINDGADDKVGDQMINFRKRQKAAEVIQDMKRWQSMPFNYNPVSVITNFLEDSFNRYVDGVDYGDKFWNLSLEREPREREDEKMARLLQESGFL